MRVVYSCRLAALCLAVAACGGGGSANNLDAGLPDAGAVSPDASGPCDPANQLGCPESQKCTLVGAGEERTVGCQTLMGQQALGDECVPGASDDCAAGLFCDGSGGVPVCVAFCTDEPVDSCPAGAACTLEISGIAATPRLCAATCDPGAQDCSRAGFACYPSRTAPTCALIGGGATPLGKGEVCEFANDCDVGFGCFRLGAEPTWRCVELCSVENPSVCDAAETCNLFPGEAWGLCIES